jgi:hypothetical protein
MGMSASAFFRGGAGFNFAVNSDGITSATPLAYPSSCRSPAKDCTPEFIVPMRDFNIITITIAGLPVTIKPSFGLGAAAIATLNMPTFKLRLGASASVSTELGGGIRFTGIPSDYAPVVTVTPKSVFTATYATVPFVLNIPSSASGTLDVLIAPTIKLLIWQTIPFTIVPAMNLKLAFTVSTGSRRLRDGDALGPRELQTVCASGKLNSAATTAGLLGVTLNEIKTFPLLKQITNIDLSKSSVVGINNFNVILVPTTVIIDPKVATYSTSGALAGEAAGCVTVGTQIDTSTSISGGGGSGGGTGGAGGTGGTGGTGGNSGTGAGAGGGASSSSSSACGTGCIVGAAVGGVVGLVAIAAVSYFIWCRPKAVLASPLSSAKNPNAIPGGGAMNPLARVRK